MTAGLGKKTAIALLLAALFSPLGAETKLINVLFITSYDSASANIAAVTDSLRAGIAASGRRAEIFLEPLDVLRFHYTEGKAAAFSRDVSLRFPGTRFDIIIAQATQALEFAAQYRDAYAPHLPIYCFDSIDEDAVLRYSRRPAIYGRVLENPLIPTLRLAARLLPRARTAYILGSNGDAGYTASLYDSLDALKEDFPYLDFQPVITEDFSIVESEIAAAGSASFAVFLPGGWKLPNGDYLFGTEAVSRLEARHRLPCFGVDETAFGSGLVGGSLVDRERLGREASELLLGILFDEDKPLSWLYSTSSVPTLDDRALRRYSIPHSLAPRNAKILFSPPGFWLRYETPLQVLGLSLLIAIVVLAIYLIFRKRERLFLLKHNESLEQTVARRTEELKASNAELEATNGNLVDSLRRIEGMQARLISEARDAVLGRVAIGLAHEINNPLAAIKAAAYSMGAVSGRGENGQGPIAGLGELGATGIDLLLRLLSGKNRGQIDAQGAGADRLHLETRLAALGLGERRALADLLCDAGLGDLPDEELILATAPENRAVLESVYRFQVIDRGIQITAEATDRIAETVEKIRSYARESRPMKGKASADVEATIDQALLIFRKELEGGVSVERRREEGLPPVAADEAELVRVWTNLIQNAMQAMGKRGRLEIELRREASFVVVDMIDSGPGVDPAIRDRLFTPFASEKNMEHGLGLGLSICKRVVEGYGGSIRYLERRGETVFSVRLPFREE
jgi:signal transduction histidine kinase